MAAAPQMRVESGPARHEDSRGDLLVEAARAGDFAKVEKLVAEGLELNAMTMSGTTVLMSAAARGHLGIVRLLLNHGAAINAKRPDGFTALTFAAFFGHDQVIRELLIRGADIEAKTRNETSAERWAAARGFFDIVEFLKQFQGIVAYPKSEHIEPAVSQLSAPVAPAEDEVESLSETTKIAPRRELIEPSPITNGRHSQPIDPVKEIRKIEVELVARDPLTLENSSDNVPPFSPLLALVDRLSASWKHVAVIILVVILLSGAVTLAALKAINRRPHRILGDEVSAKDAISTTSHQQSSEAQPSSTVGEQGKSSSVSAEPKSAEMISQQPPSNPTLPNVSDSQVNESQYPLLGHADPDLEKPRVAKTISSYRGGIAKPARNNRSNNRLQEEVANPASDSKPASVTFATKEPIPQGRRAPATSDSHSPSTGPLEGSSTKRKVIQWP